jgi:hypothetical protein
VWVRDRDRASLDSCHRGAADESAAHGLKDHRRWVESVALHG